MNKPVNTGGGKNCTSLKPRQGTIESKLLLREGELVILRMSPLTGCQILSVQPCNHIHTKNITKHSILYLEVLKHTNMDMFM